MPQQVVRLVFVFVLATAGIVIARRYLIPPTFGDDGHYRAAAVDSTVAHEKQYAGFQEHTLRHSVIADERLGLAHGSCVDHSTLHHTVRACEIAPTVVG